MPGCRTWLPLDYYHITNKVSQHLYIGLNQFPYNRITLLGISDYNLKFLIRLSKASLIQCCTNFLLQPIHLVAYLFVLPTISLFALAWFTSKSHSIFTHCFEHEKDVRNVLRFQIFFSPLTSASWRPATIADGYEPVCPGIMFCSFFMSSDHWDSSRAGRRPKRGIQYEFNSLFPLPLEKRELWICFWLLAVALYKSTKNMQQKMAVETLKLNSSWEYLSCVVN